MTTSTNPNSINSNTPTATATPKAQPASSSSPSSETYIDSDGIVTKKIFIRRPELVGVKGAKLPWADARNAKIWRHTVQTVFVLINVYIGIVFYLWVRYFETAGQSMQVAKPHGVEGWLPIAGLMNFKYTLFTGKMPMVHAAAMILLVCFMVISLFFKKAFCSWLCPIGTLSEALWEMGKKFVGKNFELPKPLDIALRSLKYVLLAFFLYIGFLMPVQGIYGFMMSEYSIISDVKMFDFFRYMGIGTAITLAVLIVGSLFVKNLWCRYLCPYGALTGILSMLSPFKIRRDAQACIDCEKCAQVCPARLPVDQKEQITSAECTACMTCVDICPAKDALQFSALPRKAKAPNGDEMGISKRWKGRKLKGSVVAWALFIIVSATVIGAKISNHWGTPFPDDMYKELIPNARSIGHF